MHVDEVNMTVFLCSPECSDGDIEFQCLYIATEPMGLNVYRMKFNSAMTIHVRDGLLIRGELQRYKCWQLW